MKTGGLSIILILVLTGCNLFNSSKDESPGYILSTDPAPDFSFVDQHGNTHTRDQYLGKVVLINFVGHT